MKELIIEVLKKPWIRILLVFILVFGLVEVVTDLTKSKTESMHNSVGGYSVTSIQTFGGVVDAGSYRRGTGKIFSRSTRSPYETGPIEVIPGEEYVPEIPGFLQRIMTKEGYTTEVTLEKVNKSAENPIVLYSKKTSDMKDFKVKIPPPHGALYRYTLTVRDGDGKFRDIRYDPLYASLKDFNVAMNVEKNKYHPEELLTMTLTNWGPNHLSYLNEWKIYRFVGWKWVKVDTWGPPENVAPVGREPTVYYPEHALLKGRSIMLEPWITKAVKLKRVPLVPGTYKITGTFGTSTEQFTLEDSFIVD
ncbi:hypothetical protein [Rossellomorea sp. YZS02]|uniref:hypothetical protein n=1 Tax=Rossellomorea sp. YZS02 TaxID=3097358 RepID=UPI002A0EA4B0|nr:hypothetical protein [Rossellomorea sp. YZS02]MDX8346141.1 hypothetical protein [Rossellomorea sp. YZS02]